MQGAIGFVSHCCVEQVPLEKCSAIISGRVYICVVFACMRAIYQPRRSAIPIPGNNRIRLTLGWYF